VVARWLHGRYTVRAMKHWVDELCDREENRAERPRGGLARIAFKRVLKSINASLTIYNKRHPEHTVKSEPTDGHGLMTVMLGPYSSRVGFEFREGNPNFNWRRIVKGTQVEEKGEIFVQPESGRMYLRFNGNNMPLGNVVRETLQPALFPNISFDEGETSDEYCFYS
jgi:hypothetical protein